MHRKCNFCRLNNFFIIQRIAFADNFSIKPMYISYLSPTEVLIYFQSYSRIFFTHHPISRKKLCETGEEFICASFLLPIKIFSRYSFN